MMVLVLLIFQVLLALLFVSVGVATIWGPVFEEEEHYVPPMRWRLYRFAKYGSLWLLVLFLPGQVIGHLFPHGSVSLYLQIPLFFYSLWWGYTGLPLLITKMQVPSVSPAFVFIPSPLRVVKRTAHTLRLLFGTKWWRM